MGAGALPPGTLYTVFPRDKGNRAFEKLEKIGGAAELAPLVKYEIKLASPAGELLLIASRTAVDQSTNLLCLPTSPPAHGRTADGLRGCWVDLA